MAGTEGLARAGWLGEFPGFLAGRAQARVGQRQGIVRLWDLELDGASVVLEPDSHGTTRHTNCLAFSHDGRALAIPHLLEGPALYDPASGRRLADARTGHRA